MTARDIVRVRDVMKKEFDIVDGMTTVSEALKKMKQKITRNFRTLLKNMFNFKLKLKLSYFLNLIHKNISINIPFT